MFDFPQSMLSQQAAARPRTGEELEAFGKQAAALYETGRQNLSAAVVATVKHAGLSPEQVQRVIEFANHAAYLTGFQKESAAHRVVSFRGGPADPAVVLQDLNDGGGGSVYDSGLGDYALVPSSLLKAASDRNSQRLGLDDVKLAAAFGLTGEAVIAPADPLLPAYDARVKLAGAYEATQMELSGEESRYLDICDALTYEVKQAALGGTPLSQIVAAWGEVCSEPVFVKAAFDMLVGRLLSNGVFHSREEIADSLTTKVASSGVVNPSHPLVHVYRDFCGSLQKMAGLRRYGEECVEAVDTLDAFLQETLKEASTAGSIGAAVGKAIRTVPKAWRAATETTARLEAPAKELSSKFLEGAGLTAETSEALGNGAGKVVKYLPHIGAGLAGEEAYQRARYNPVVQGTSNFVQSRIPYTQPYMIRQYSLQNGLV